MSAVIDANSQLAPVEPGGAVAVHSKSADGLLSALTAAAENPHVDIEKVKELFALHEKVVARDAETAFNAAMSRAQAKIEPVANNAANDHTSSRYAKLAAINRAITPIYTAEGISISFDTADSPVTGCLRIVAMVSHSAGHTRKYHIDLPPDDSGSQGKVNKTRVQATGSTNSYGRRYLVMMIFNVATEDDNDGNRGDPEGMPEKQYADFDAAIDALTDAAAGKALWKSIVATCKTMRDRGAYNKLKAKIEKKAESLKGKSK